MRINLVLELLDVPGQLIKILEPISMLGANLITIIHKRDYKSENGRLLKRKKSPPFSLATLLIRI